MNKKIAAIYDLTGDQSSLDLPSSKGALLAAKEINARKNQKDSIILILEDGETNPNTLKLKVNEVLEYHPDVLAFLGLSDSDQLLAAAGEAANQERIFMTSGATSPKLTEQVPEYLYLACFGDNVQAAAAAEWAFNHLNARTVSILWDSEDTFTTLLEGYFKERFLELGGQIVSRVSFNSNSLETAVQEIEDADFVFFSCLPQHVEVGIEKIREKGIDKPIFGGDSFDGLNFWTNTQINQVFFTTHAYVNPMNQNPAVQAFIAQYSEEFNGEMPTAFSALGYDALQLLVKGLEVQEELKLQSLQLALDRMGMYEGITGMIEYKDGKRIPNKTVTIMTVENGHLELGAEIVPEKIPNP